MNKFISNFYPMLVILIGLYILLTHNAHAGHIRQLALGPDHPGVVNLAIGRTTAISFSVRPEKVVPGSPQAIEVNFLGKDITIRPLSLKPGNLLVYTKSSRYVILFQLQNDSQYDDVVRVGQSFEKNPLRLSEDAYRVITISMKLAGPSKTTSLPQIPVMLSSSEKSIESSELKDALEPFKAMRCSDCLLHRGIDFLKLSCSVPIQHVFCKTAKGQLELSRNSS